MPKSRMIRRASMDEVPTSSFADIAFLLIIFFILVTTLEQFEGFRANLPAGEQSSEPQAEESPTVKLHNDGITFGEESLGIDQLREKLLALRLGEREKEEERIVIIEATGNVKYQNYFETMAVIRHAQGVVGILKEGEQK